MAAFRKKVKCSWIKKAIDQRTTIYQVVKYQKTPIKNMEISKIVLAGVAHLERYPINWKVRDWILVRAHA